MGLQCLGLTKGLNYSIEVEIEMEHRVPTFSIFYLFRKGRFSSCMIHLLLLLFLRVRFVWCRRCLSVIWAQTSGVCGNMFLKMSFIRYVTCWGP